MLFQLLNLLILFLYAGCGDDISSNRKPGTVTQPQTAENVNTVLISGIHRERGRAAPTYRQEITTNSRGSFVRSIPEIQLDDEGSNISGQSRTDLGRPSIDCGNVVSQTLAQKIADCQAKNGNRASWNGSTLASGSEGLWTLVTLNSSGFEIWLDRRTGMVWSDSITDGNWCRASGNIQNSDGNAIGIDCGAIGGTDNLCGNFDVSGSTRIQWRLPTRNDYLQADLDGIRYVLKPDLDQNYWTATPSAEPVIRVNAWSYNFSNGTLVSEPMNLDRNIRCIGVANF